MNPHKIVNFLRSSGKVFFGIPLTIISLIFIAKILYDSADKIIPHLIDVNVFTLILAILFFQLFFLTRAIVFWQALKLKDEKPQLLTSILYFSFGETRRYIPGNIFSFASRINYFSKLEVSTKNTLQSILLDLFILVFTSFLVSIPGIFFTRSQIEDTLGIPVSPLLVGALIVSGIIFLLIALRILIKRERISKLPYVDIIDTTMLGIATWSFYGIGAYFTASSFTYINPANFLQVTSFFVLAWLIGFLSVVAPMGLGVREFAISVGLSKIMPLYLGSVIALALRLVILISELLFITMVYSLYVKKSSLKKFENLLPVSLIILMSTIFIGYFSFFAIEKHLNFFTGRYDLGNMDQTVWNTLHGNFFMMTNPDGVGLMSRLGVHSDFILVLLSPFYLIWSDPRMLQIIQVVTAGAGAIFIYLLTKLIMNKYFDAKNSILIATAFSIAYLLNPFIQKQILFDFHSVVLATTFLLGAFYFLLRKSYVWFFVFLSLSVLTKENVFLVAALLGLYIGFFQKRKWGYLLSIVGFTSFYLLVAKFIPAARGNVHFALEYFQDFGESPKEILLNLILKPHETLTHLFAPDHLEYYNLLLAPLGYLALLAPWYIIFAAPDLGINVLSSNDNLRDPTFHYAAIIIPFIFISSIYGVVILKKYLIKNLHPRIVFYYILLFSIFSTWNYGLLPGSQYPALEIFNRRLPYRTEVKNYLNTIPEEAKVGASNNLGAHLSQREYIFVPPQGLEESEYLVFLLNDVFAPLDYQRSLVNKLLVSEDYTLEYHVGEFYAFKKLTTNGRVYKRMESR